MARKSLPSLFAQLDLTEFLVRVEEEGFVSPLDILELSDEEIKTFATEIGMKRGHIARWARESRVSGETTVPILQESIMPTSEGVAEKTLTSNLDNNTIVDKIRDIDLNDQNIMLTPLPPPSTTTLSTAPEVYNSMDEVEDINMKNTENVDDQNNESQQTNNNKDNTNQDNTQDNEHPKFYGGGYVGSSALPNVESANKDGSTNRLKRPLTAMEQAREAALKRREASMKKLNVEDTKYLEKKQKATLIGKIETCYAQIKREPPMGLAASKLDSLQRHLEYIRERVLQYKNNPSLHDEGKIFEARFGAQAAELESQDKAKDTEVVPKMED